MSMDRVKKSNHCAYQTHYHIVFPVKYRKALLREEIVKIKDLAKEIGERYEIEFEEVGCDQDHIHFMLISSKI
jgi:putative transposase